MDIDDVTSTQDMRYKLAEALQRVNTALRQADTRADPHLSYRLAAAELSAATSIAKALAHVTRPAPVPKRRDPPAPSLYAPIPVHIGWRLKRARDEAGLTDREAADGLGMAVSTYRAIERGKGTAKVETAERIAGAPWLPEELGREFVESMRQAVDDWNRDRLAKWQREQASDPTGLPQAEPIP